MRLPSTMASALIAGSRLELFRNSEPWVVGTRRVIGRLVAAGLVDLYRVAPGGKDYYLLNDAGRDYIGILEP